MKRSVSLMNRLTKGKSIFLLMEKAGKDVPRGSPFRCKSARRISLADASKLSYSDMVSYINFVHY